MALPELRLQDRLLRVVEDNDTIDRWITALVARHTRSMRRSDLLKAARALSARYVERRSELVSRSATDSAGKRAAFATLFAPLHYVTTRAIGRELGLRRRSLRIVDLGCGTGVCAAALWSTGGPAVLGVDSQAWVLEEATWNWRQLGIPGRTHRGDMLAALSRSRPSATGVASEPTTLAVLGWSANELTEPSRTQLLRRLIEWHRCNHAVLVIEPIANRVVPWWDDWLAAFPAESVVSNEWAFDEPLPTALRDLDAAAGFRRDALRARSLFVGPTRAVRPVER